MCIQLIIHKTNLPENILGIILSGQIYLIINGEEAAGSLEVIKPIAYCHIHIEGPEPPNLPGPYPDGYMQFCFCTVLSLDPFKSDYETSARKLFSPAEARKLNWIKNCPELYGLGLEEAMKYA